MIKLLSCFTLLFSISFAQDSTVTLKVSDLEKLAVAEIKSMAAMNAADWDSDKWTALAVSALVYVVVIFCVIGFIIFN